MVGARAQALNGRAGAQLPYDGAPAHPYPRSPTGEAARQRPRRGREAMPVDAVTLRRWVEAPVHEVWRRLVDIDGLLAADPSLDVLELVGEGGRFGPGSVAVLRRRHGPRVSTLEVEVVEATPPIRLSLTITHGHARWAVAAELEPLGGHTTDIALHARRDPCIPAGRLMRATAARADDHRLAVDLVRTLERLVDRVDRPQGDDDAGTGPQTDRLAVEQDGISVEEYAPGVAPTRQRIAPGR
jgi:uncharacterized protein YndB with AHSA1/START domain